MSNPWKDIQLSDYEGHMNLASVKQLPVLKNILKEQLSSYDINGAMILGVAGGTGLENVKCEQLQTLYGIDINEGFLAQCEERFGHLLPMLKLINADLMDQEVNLPKSDLVICNLVAEYIGYESLMRALVKTESKYASVVIQVNKQNNFVSDSPYLKAFERLDEVHCLMEEDILASKLSSIDFEQIYKKTEELPNGKLLVRLDFAKKTC